MSISAGAAALIGAVIGGAATFGASWLQKSRDIEWERAQRDQEKIANLGYLILKMRKNFDFMYIRQFHHSYDELESHFKELNEFQHEAHFLILTHAQNLEDRFLKCSESLSKLYAAMLLMLAYYPKNSIPYEDTTNYEKSTKEAVDACQKAYETYSALLDQIIDLYRKKFESRFEPEPFDIN